VLRAAVAEVEDYVRVDVVSDSRDLVAGSAVSDMIHLLAELGPVLIVEFFHPCGFLHRDVDAVTCAFVAGIGEGGHRARKGAVAPPAEPLGVLRDMLAA
jgi:hypothetical protein